LKLTPKGWLKDKENLESTPFDVDYFHANDSENLFKSRFSIQPWAWEKSMLFTSRFSVTGWS
jgi:hypothetical protein